MKTNSLKMNALLNIIYTISNIIFPIVIFPYISRILLAEGVGKVSFFTAVTNYAVVIASLGISTYGIRATAKVRNDKKELSKVTVELMSINLFSSFIVIIILILLIPFINRFSADKSLLLINCVSIFCSALCINWLYSGLEQYLYITKRTIFLKVVSLILIFRYVCKSSDYIVYAAISTFSTVASSICNLCYSRKFISLSKIGKLELKKHIKPMMLLFGSILAVNIYTNLDTIMLGFISGNREVGLYTIAVKVKCLLLSAINAISVVLLPRLSYYLSQNKSLEFDRILKKSTSYIFILSIPLIAFFMIETKDCILLLGGQDYVDATLCMQILIPIFLISGFSNITGNQILIPLGKDFCFMLAVITGSVVDIILNSIFMPKLGCIGAAMATLFAEFTQMLVQLRFAWKYIVKNIQINSIVKAVLGTAIDSVIIIGIRKMIYISWYGDTINTLVNLIIYAGIFGCIYCIILLIFKEKYTNELFLKILRK